MSGSDLKSVDAPHRRPCPVCGGTDAIALHHQGFVLAEGVPLPTSYDVVSCVGCGSVFADTCVPQSEYDAYYARYSRYEDPSVATGGGDSDDDLRRLRETVDTLLALPGAGSTAARVLDAGCARGGLLRELRRRGFRSLAGLDPSPGCVARVRADGFAGFHARLSELPAHVAPGSFDLIVLSHVLEHLVDVAQALRMLAACLAPGGTLYVEVPDAARYADVPFVPFYFFDPEHINHFDRASLANLAAVHRLRVTAAGQRDIAIGDGQKYPVVWGAFTQGDAQGALVFSDALRSSVARYVRDCAARAGADALQRLAAQGTRVLLWGAGSHTQRLLQGSALKDCRIVAIVDRDARKQGETLFGHEIERPEDALPRLSADDVVVIASALHAEAIRSDLRSLGLRNPVVVAQ